MRKNSVVGIVVGIIIFAITLVFIQQSPITSPWKEILLLGVPAVIVYALIRIGG